MYKKIKNIFFLITFISFIFLVTKYYFSEQNKILTNKSRSSYLVVSGNEKNNLPVLKNDTNNIIVYINDLEDFKNKRKKRFWEKLISDQNE
mgnify:FL=1